MSFGRELKSLYVVTTTNKCKTGVAGRLDPLSLFMSLFHSTECVWFFAHLLCSTRITMMPALISGDQQRVAASIIDILCLLQSTLPAVVQTVLCVLESFSGKGKKKKWKENWMPELINSFHFSLNNNSNQKRFVFVGGGGTIKSDVNLTRTLKMLFNQI